MMPGLTGLLPRHLAGDGFDRVDDLTAYVGGLGTFTMTAAVDYLAALGGGYGKPFASWRSGARALRSLVTMRRVALPFFPGVVTAHPYLSLEAERLPAALGLREIRWYSVFDGEGVPFVLARHRASAADEVTAASLLRAAALDSFGRTPYQLMVFRLDGEAGGTPGFGPSSAAAPTRACSAPRSPPGPSVRSSAGGSGPAPKTLPRRSTRTSSSAGYATRGHRSGSK